MLPPAPYCYGPLKGFVQQRIGTPVACRHCKAQVLTYRYPQIGLEVHICQCLACFMRAAGRPALSARVWADLVADVAIAGVAEAAERTGPHGGGN